MDKSRQQFEEEFMKHSILDATDIFRTDTETGDYYYLAPSQAWFWWQASRESLEVELPKEQKAKAYDFYTDGYNSGIDCCELRLESMGIKVIRNE